MVVAVCTFCITGAKESETARAKIPPPQKDAGRMRKTKKDLCGGPQNQGFLNAAGISETRAGIDKSALMFLRRQIAFPDDAQPVEGEQVGHGLDVFGVVAERPRQAAGGEDFGFAAQLLQKARDDSIDETEIAEKQARLNAGDGVG